MDITLNKPKCTLAFSSIEFLGHLLTNKGISPSPSKVEAIKLMPIPQSKEKLYSFFGLATYGGQIFVPDFASLAALLCKICSWDSSFNWDDSTTNAFETLHSAIVNFTATSWFDSSAPVTIHTDTSGDGIGCCFLQNEKPVTCASCKLTSAETQYSAIELEFLSIVYALHKFDHLLFNKFLVMINHKPIVG